MSHTGNTTARTAPRLPYTDIPLPGIDPRWSSTVEVASNAACEPVRGRVRRWHVLDNQAVLNANGKKPVGTVLALHGNPTWSYLWRDVITAATNAEHPWRVVAVDHLDMGFSERTGLNRRYDDRIQDLSDLTAAMGLDDGPVVTLAHDWGGLISMGWAELHPMAHAGLIMTNTAVYHDPAAGPIPAPLRLALSPAAHSLLTARTAAFLNVSVGLVDSGIPDDIRQAFGAPYRSAADRQGIQNFVADIPVFASHPSNPRYERTAAWVATATVPALLLWGTKDPVFKEQYLQDLLHRLPHATVHRYEGANHLLPQDRPIQQPIMQWLTETFVDAATHRQRHHAARPASTPKSPGADIKLFHTGLTERAAQQEYAWEIATADMGPATNDAAPSVKKRLSWTELDQRVNSVASGLLNIGVRPGDRINLMIPPGTDLTTLIYACFRIGAVIVVADTGLGAAGLSRALRGASPTWLVGIPRALTAAKALGWPGTRISVGTMDPARARALGVKHSITELAKTPPIPFPQLDPDADAAVLFTSGSTGPAKGVVYTQRQMAAMRDAVASVCDLHPGTGLVAAFAPFALLAPAMGAASVTPDMDVTKPRTLTARALADAASAIEATSVFASPAALVNVLATQNALSDHQRQALSNVKLMLSAGAPLPPPLLEDLQDLLPHAVLHTPYGMTECLPLTDVDLPTIRQAAADAQPHTSAPEATSSPTVRGAGGGVCVGTAVPGAVVRIRPLDADGVPTGELTEEPGVLGEIVAQAPHMKDRYDHLWITESESTRIPGWHSTSDVGHFDAAGRLWVEGRLSHLLHTAHGVVAPVAAEHAAAEVPGVGRTAIVGVGAKGAQVAVAVCETDPASPTVGPARPALSAKVRAAVAASTGIELAAVLVVQTHPTDIRHNSKIDRTLLAKWAQEALGGGKIKNP
ncbi:MAG: alpha/beta fold hydrolase [Kocuria sp.]|nr:alpha/beta fold hydrolase [Kocuria sp.]